MRGNFKFPGFYRFLNDTGTVSPAEQQAAQKQSSRDNPKKQRENIRGEIKQHAFLCGAGGAH